MYFLSILLSREKLTINISFALFWNLFFNSHLFSIQRLRTNSYVSFVSFTLSCFAFASERYSWIIGFCELFKYKCISVHLLIANTYNYKIMFFLCIFSSFHMVSIFFVCSSWTVHVDVCYRGISLNCLICLIVILSPRKKKTFNSLN